MCFVLSGLRHAKDEKSMGIRDGAGERRPRTDDNDRIGIELSPRRQRGRTARVRITLKNRYPTRNYRQ